MPPPNVLVFSTAMAVVVPPLATILLLLSTFIPPTMTPLSKIPPPLRNARLTTENAASADRARIGDATAEGGVADHHRCGVAAKDSRIWPLEWIGALQTRLLRRDAA
jgi:hypothetical protein